MSYTRDQAIAVHKDYQETVNNWEYYIRSYNGGYDYMIGQYLNRYNLELDNEFNQRLANTPCDNHCKNVIQIYSSFLFRVKPSRNFGSLADEQSLEMFMKDADLEGNSLSNVVKQTQNFASIYGHCFMILDKPNIQTSTRAEELQQDIRPYVSIVTPENVLDWNFERQPNGKYELNYLKIREEVDRDGGTYMRIWYPDRIDTVYMPEREEPRIIDTVDNQIGKIPAVILYNSKSHKRGIGQSDLTDIADLQKSIYNEYSEMEQLIRLTNHPSLVKTPSVNASAGAGAVIEMPDELEPNLKPYLLQPSGSNLTAIMDSIDNKVNSINRIAHIGAVRTTKTNISSGVALQTEFELLNARLSEKADNLEIAEEQLFGLYGMFQDTAFDGEINYPDSFNIRDYATDLLFYQQAKAINVPSPTLGKEIDKEIARAVVDDDEKLNNIFDEIDSNSQVGEFTQDEPAQEDQEVEQEEI
nr:portal protein [uncultured Mediterranean phage uvMED]BAR38417.1 portal protein [uncultured Mediterranean phage uvMED]